MAPGLFSRRSYDADASAYAAVPTSTSPQQHPTTSTTTTPTSAIEPFSDEEEEEAGGERDMEVLREEEEREKLLSGGQGLFGSIGRKVGNGSIKIGKKVRGVGRRKGVREVVAMMGGKRLGMEEGGEFGIGGGSDTSDSEIEEDDLLAEKLAYERKPRKPNGRSMLLVTSILLTFLMLLIFASLSLSTRSAYPINPRPATLSNGTHSFRPTTLLISLDGFRADFLSRHLTPTLSAFVASGLSPRFMTPSFPSVTFPNHWTLVTGLYPESHGIVGNSFFDPATGKEFYYTDPARSHSVSWWGGEPIWATAEKQGVKTAVHMWPGSEAADGWGITYLDRYNGSEVLPRKTSRILEFLDKELVDRPQLIAAYVPNIDSVGHKFGPNTTQTDDVIRAVDDMFAELLKGLDARNITELINIVVVSDHGMASTSNDRLIYIDDIIDMSQISHTDGWPLYGLRPAPHVNLTALHDTLKAEVAANAAKGDSHWDVFLRDGDMPERWHFSNNARIAPLWIVPETGYAIVTRSEFDVSKAAPGQKYSPAGLHGYDNTHPLMRAVFIARGPAFSHLHGSGGAWRLDEHDGGGGGGDAAVHAGVVEPFANVEVYRMLCDTLGLKEPAAGTNATLAGVDGLRIVIDDGEEEEKKEGGSSEPKLPLPVTKTQTTAAATAAPTPTQLPTDSTADEDSEANKQAMDWLEYVKMKAEKLKDALDKWWEGVWVDGTSDISVSG